MWIVLQHYNISYETVRGNFFYNCRESFKDEAKFGRRLTVTGKATVSKVKIMIEKDGR